MDDAVTDDEIAATFDTSLPYGQEWRLVSRLRNVEHEHNDWRQCGSVVQGGVAKRFQLFALRKLCVLNNESDPLFEYVMQQRRVSIWVDEQPPSEPVESVFIDFPST